jgi:LAO/AO transport system kinase
MAAADSDSSIESLARALRAGDRGALARSITLVESRRPDHQRQAHALLKKLAPLAGRAMRVGITGAPGVGKSTFIDALGSNLTAAGRKVAVLAVDPSSGRTGGSILGDKTRMARLAADPGAYIRPSPASGALGGVAARTRDSMALCEAAGFDVLLVETVGVGQSETAVADMTDFFLVLVLPGGGDELQGLKKGVIELADLVAVNKADANPGGAAATAAEYGAALRLLAPASASWTPEVMQISGLTNQGLDRLWSEIERHRALADASGDLSRKRASQNVKWLWAMLEERLKARVFASQEAKVRLRETEAQVAGGTLTAEEAVERLLANSALLLPD